MYREFFGIEGNPFSNTPDPLYFFRSERHVIALAHLVYGVEGGTGFAMLTGEVGTGKTTLCRCMLEQLSDRIELALCTNPRLSETEFLAMICDEFGIYVIDDTYNAKDYTDALNNHFLSLHAEGKRAVLIIDEAQNLTTEVLEQVRLLTNLETSKAKLLQIILVGQPELQELLGRYDMRQVNQRITARYHLEPMNKSETGEYIKHRLEVAGMNRSTFDSGAISEIWKISKGVPRIINAVSERCLLGAYARGQKRIDRRLASRAAQEVMGGELPHTQEPKSLVPVLALMILIVVGIFIFQNRGSALGVSQKAFSVAGVLYDKSIRAMNVIIHGEQPRAGKSKTSIKLEPEPAHFNSYGIRDPLSAVYRMWKIDFDKFSFINPCGDVKTLGFRCLRGKGNWDDLKRINRPALVSLEDVDGSIRYGVVMKVNEELVTMNLDGEIVTSPTRDFASTWLGNYFVIWRAPSAFSRVMKPGMSGEDIAWLRIRLSEIDGSKIDSENLFQFDKLLGERVIEFKRSHELEIDNIVDVVTMINLNTAIANGNVPLLNDIGPN